MQFELLYSGHKINPKFKLLHPYLTKGLKKVGKVARGQQELDWQWIASNTNLTPTNLLRARNPDRR